MILSTARLSIRELVEDDAPFIVELLNDPAFIQYVGDKGVRTLDEGREYIKSGPRAMYAEFGFGLWLVQLPDRTPIGMCGLLKRAVLDDVDLGFALMPQFRREGYTFEAASAVMGYARDRLRLDRLVAIVNPDNDASAKLLQRLGFTFEEQRTVFPGAAPLNLFATSLKRGHSTLR